MSRILGSMTTCPASNMSAFNIDSSVVDYSISDIISFLPEPLASQDVQEEKKRFLRELEYSPDNPISFAEPPFIGNNSLNGDSKVEYELFGDNMPLRSSLAAPGSPTSSAPSGNSMENAEKYLKPLELRKYKAALHVDKKDVISKYLRIIQTRISDSSE